MQRGSPILSIDNLTYTCTITFFVPLPNDYYRVILNGEKMEKRCPDKYSDVHDDRLLVQCWTCDKSCDEDDWTKLGKVIDRIFLVLLLPFVLIDTVFLLATFRFYSQ